MSSKYNYYIWTEPRFWTEPKTTVRTESEFFSRKPNKTEPKKNIFRTSLLSWLLVSFLLHVKYTILYRI